MNSRIALFIGLALTAALAPACRGSRGLANSGAAGSLPAETLLLSLNENQVKAEWLDARARISYDSDDQSLSATASIKLRRDSALWISVKKFGFEVARALVTPDSVFVIDRINNEYAAEPLSYINKRFNLPASFDMLQRIILGNPVFIIEEGYGAGIEEGQYHLSATAAGKENHFYLSNPGRLMTRAWWAETETKRKVDITYENYTDAGGNGVFSYLRKLNVNAPETGRASVEIEFNEVIFDVPTPISFEIPPRYERKN
jgi:hypothetical protein